VFGETHLRGGLKAYASCYNEARGHLSRCSSFSADAEDKVIAAELPAAKRTSELGLLEQLLRMDAYLAHPAFHGETNVRVHALWFNENQRKLCACSRDQRQFVVMDQPDIERLFEVLRADHGKA